MKIDPYRMWRLLEDRIAQESNPLHRRQLETIVTHMKGEAMGDIDHILTTVSPDAVYVFYGLPETKPQLFRGHDEIRTFYNAMLDQISVNQELCVDRVVVDDHCVVTEGVTRTALRGRTLAAAGIAVDDVDAYYYSEGRSLVIWPFDPVTGLLLGEQIYTATRMPLEDSARQKLAPEDIGSYSAVAA
jgi:hypothetical protein